MMNIIIEIIITFFLLIFHIFEAIFLFFIPTGWRKKDIHGEIVLITGAASGIGRLLAFRFADLGCVLVLWDINKEGVESTATELRKSGSKVFPYQCDVSKREEIYEVAKKVRRDVGNVTILVNNAGIVTGKQLLDSPDNMIQKTMDVNATSHFWTLKAFLPSMMEHNHGHIVSIASVAGLVGVNGLVDYCSSKFAAVGLDEALRFELEIADKLGVHTTVVCPYFVNTGMFDGCQSRFEWLLPTLEPDYVADKAVEAVVTNQRMLCLPRIMYLILALKGILPHKATLLLGRFTGADRFMESFAGRQKQE